MVILMSQLILAMELFQDEHQVRMTFYCNIQDIKEGYMYINLGKLDPIKAIWTGLGVVLSRLAKQYRDRELRLAFPSAYLQLDGGELKHEAMRVMNLFNSWEFISDSEYQKSLKNVNLIGIKSEYPINFLKGYSLSEYEELLAAATTNKEIYSINAVYYNGASLPPSGACLDFESTSTYIKYARVIEFGALKFTNGEITDTIQSLINPKMKIPKAVRNLTGIAQCEVNRAPYSYEAMKKIVHFLEDCECLVGHNILYDFSLLDLYCQRFKLPRLNIKLICTRRLAKEANLVVKDYKLETLLQLYGITNERPHRALPDSKASFHLLKKIYGESFLI